MVQFQAEEGESWIKYIFIVSCILYHVMVKSPLPINGCIGTWHSLLTYNSRGTVISSSVLQECNCTHVSSKTTKVFDLCSFRISSSSPHEWWQLVCWPWGVMGSVRCWCVLPSECLLHCFTLHSIQDRTVYMCVLLFNWTTLPWELVHALGSL